MCKDRSVCLCHLLRDAIENDKQEEFKAFFIKTITTDLYLFLKDGYQLQGITDSKLFTSSLRTLIKEFITGGEQINLSRQETELFMTQCDSFFEGESTLDEMKNGLALILYKAEKLTYQNLSGQEGFDNYLNQYNQTKQDNTAHLEKSKSVACGKCSIL